MRLDQFMRENFPGLDLSPPLFYNWDIGIRFELGKDYDSDKIYDNCPYLKGVYKRAITLFQTLNLPKDDIYMVVDVDNFGDGEAFKHKINIFSKYVKEKSILYTLQQQTIPGIFQEDDEDVTYETHRFILKCKQSDIKYIPLLKSICNQDMGLKPLIYHRVYFININNKTIYHVYDDRGCDLLATSPETIRGLYETYNEWVLDYDRSKIDKVFQ